MRRFVIFQNEGEYIGENARLLASVDKGWWYRKLLKQSSVGAIAVLDLPHLQVNIGHKILLDQSQIYNYKKKAVVSNIKIIGKKKEGSCLSEGKYDLTSQKCQLHKQSREMTKINK